MSSFNDTPSSAMRCGAYSGTWHAPMCITGLAAAAVLLASWLIPMTRGWWNAMDHAVFHALNPTLAAPGLWQSFWALTNWRPFDLVAAAIIFGFTLAWLRGDGGQQARLRLAHFLAFCVLLLLGKACEHLLLDLTGYRRASPTLAFPEAIRLSEIISWVAVKDRSSMSFPGDHAFVIFATIGFFWICAGRRTGMVALLALAPFTLPRVVGGAHWATDIVVGGMTMALLLLSLGYATPAAATLARAIDRFASPLLQFAISVARKLHILR
jgi:membrane-associated phospholipid phosphatase